MSTEITGLIELTTTSDNDLLLVRQASTGADKKMRAVNLRAKATTKDDVGLSSVTNDEQLKRASNLSDLANTTTARTNLGLGTAAVQADTRYNHRANNLSDVASAATARTNLGLGTAAVQPDTRYAHRASNLSDLGSAATARTNLGLGTAATQADTKYAHRTNNLNDLSNAATARTNLGLGTAATQADTKYAHRENNLSDLANATTARTNLGLGNVSNNAQLKIASNLSDLANATTARTNLGLGNVTNNAQLKIASNLSDLANTTTARTNLGLGTAAVSTVVTSNSDVTAGRLLTTVAGPEQAFRRGNILGPVSQSGGIPTGAIIERGSNANGEFVRYADGTQICRRTVTTRVTASIAEGSLYRSAGESFTFPIAFSVAPTVSPVAENVIGNICWAAKASASTTTVTGTLYILSFFNDGQAAIQYIAIGRWF